jgi:hypothetical protein
VDACIEPCFGNLSVKSICPANHSHQPLFGARPETTEWDDVMVVDLKHYDGSLRPIDRVPQHIKALYATAFEVETSWIVEAAARRRNGLTRQSPEHLRPELLAKTGRHVQARLVERIENDLLPAHTKRDPR